MNLNQNTFKRLAQYYDVIYKKKNYAREVQIIDRMIDRYMQKSSKRLLEIGCGTGEYLMLFAKKGYKTTGLDRSADMIKIARKKTQLFKRSIQIFLGDGRTYKFNKKFDVIITLFDVLSYQITDTDVTAFLSNIYDHLNKGGLLIVDCWYGPRVLQDTSHPPISVFRKDPYVITRSKKSTLLPGTNSVAVTHTIRVEKNTKSVETFTEKHVMRYFFRSEIAFFLQSCGFTIKQQGMEYSYMHIPKKSSWSILYIAKKEKTYRR